MCTELDNGLDINIVYDMLSFAHGLSVFILF